MACRLALDAPTEHAPIAHAVWRRSKAGVVGKEIGCIKADEKAMGRWLGRVQEIEGAGGASLMFDAHICIVLTC